MNTSLVAGALSWGLSALILLIPVFVGIGNRDPEFGYNQESGKLAEKCFPKTIIYFLFRHLYNIEEARPIHNFHFLYCGSLRYHFDLLLQHSLPGEEIKEEYRVQQVSC